MGDVIADIFHEIFMLKKLQEKFREACAEISYSLKSSPLLGDL